MNYYDQIKEKLIDNEITKRVKDYGKNKSDLQTYYNVGRILSEAGSHYGEGIIKEYSEKLLTDLGKKYTYTFLSRMRQFYNKFKNVATLSQYLTYSHYIELLPYNLDKIQYYIKIIEQQHLSVRQLRHRIKSNEYERLTEETKLKLIENKKLEIFDEIKDPIIIHSNNKDIYDIKEKVLKKLILDNIEEFLKQLGNGYSFIGSEYKIKVGSVFNYIDILLFNYIYNCFVVVELKVTELKKEHIGQVMCYMNYIDENLKQINMDRTIGLIVVRENNKYVIKYSSDKRIKAIEYSFE